MKKLPLFLFASGLLLCLVTPGYSHPHLLRTADGQEISFPELIRELQDARAVFVGEVHNQPSHHQAQLEVIRSLHQAGGELAIGLEMFRREDQAALDRWVAGRLPTAQFERIFNRQWEWFPLYRPIFEYAREHKIKLLALNVPREVVRQVAENGFASLSSEQLEKLGPIRCNVDPAYREFIRRSLGVHGHLEEASFEHFCEAQLVWDTAMAQHLQEYLQGHPTATVVVLAGRGHAWKYGIPSRLDLPEEAYKVVLPEEAGRISPELIDSRDADFLWLTEGLEAVPGPFR